MLLEDFMLSFLHCSANRLIHCVKQRNLCLLIVAIMLSQAIKMNNFVKNQNMSSLTITTIQADLKWEDKKSNLSMFENKIEAIEGHKELVILPEMFSTGFSMNTKVLAETMDGESIKWMEEMSKKHKIILTGSLIIEEDGKYFNRLVWMMPNGHYGYYDKRHLFGYAGEDNFYTSGERRLITSVNGWKINLQICYDLRFPVWSRQQVVVGENDTAPEYDVLIIVANWPAKRSHAWKSLLCARAIENQCFVVGVNRVGNDGNGFYHSGDSTIIDPMGEKIYEYSDLENVFTTTLHKDQLETVRKTLPFLKDADSFNIHHHQ